MNLRKLAKGRDCMIRIDGICNFNPETTVLAHYRMAGLCGIGNKPNNLQGSWACSACHDACDGRTKTAYSRDELRLMHLEGVMRTIDILVREFGLPA